MLGDGGRFGWKRCPSSGEPGGTGEGEPKFRPPGPRTTAPHREHCSLAITSTPRQYRGHSHGISWVKSISFINLISMVKSSSLQAGWIFYGFLQTRLLEMPTFFFFFQIICMVLVLLPRQTYKRVIFQKRQDVNDCNNGIDLLPGSTPLRASTTSHRSARVLPSNPM